MCLKLYIDGLFYKGTGIGRYYESLIKEFAKKGIQIYTCVPKRLKKEFERDLKGYLNNIETIFVDYEKFSLKSFIEHSFTLKKLEYLVNLFLFPHINLPFYVPKNTVVTIHDLRPLTNYWDRSFIKKKIFIFYLKRALKKSRGIIAISNNVKDELKKYSKDLQDKIKVIYEFIDEKFYTYKSLSNPIIKDDYILFVGNRKKHKNLTSLILAFARIKNKSKVKLVIAGTKENKNKIDKIDLLIKKLNMERDVIQIFSPSDDQLINLYQHAKLFVFPSLIEGFGLPPLEAIAAGCPVIASNIPVMKEILGERIACFDPNNVDDIAEKLLEALTNHSLKIQLLNEGKNRLSLFEKDKIINEYINYFSNLLKLI